MGHNMNVQTDHNSYLSFNHHPSTFLSPLTFFKYRLYAFSEGNEQMGIIESLVKVGVKCPKPPMPVFRYRKYPLSLLANSTLAGQAYLKLLLTVVFEMVFSKQNIRRFPRW